MLKKSDELYERAVKEAKLLIEGKLTIRLVAKEMKISKSTVHKDFNVRLIESPLYPKVREILDKNFSERAIRGGIATRKKYLKKV